jgi:peroxiredoxin Q/BCP
VEVVGVSRDDVETLERFRKDRELPFPLVSDATGAISRAYRVRWPILGLARRVTFLVGRDRRIRLAFHSERDPRAHPARVLQEAGGAARG